MVKLVISMVLISLSCNSILSGQTFLLKEIDRPEMIEVTPKGVFLLQGATIFQYATKSLSLVSRIGKEGEGPGELRVVPGYSNRIKVFSDYIFAESIDKVVLFSFDGKVLKEMKKPLGILQLVPFQSRFVGIEIRSGEDRVIYSVLSIYDSELKREKELFLQKFVQQGNQFDTVMDLIHFQVTEDKILVEESPKGFSIEVFDGKGKQLYEIKRDYKKLKVTEQYKKEMIEEIETDPWMKLSGGWKQMSKMIKFNFSEHFPAIQDMIISKEKIYIKTYERKGNKEEYLVLDMKGKLLATIYLNAVQKPAFNVRIIGSRLYTIYEDSLYFLKENSEKEEWKLHIEAIKF